MGRNKVTKIVDRVNQLLKEEDSEELKIYIEEYLKTSASCNHGYYHYHGRVVKYEQYYQESYLKNSNKLKLTLLFPTMNGETIISIGIPSFKKFCRNNNYLLDCIKKIKNKPVCFVSGHRDITEEEFNRLYVPELEKKQYTHAFVVGDCDGVDIMAQDWLSRHVQHRCVTIYHMFDKPRHIAANDFNLSGGYTSDEERDAAMTNASREDLAFVRHNKWNSGTAQNIKRRYTF